ncbi:MAG: autotransporter outer membrane beta-barrel domain-containing protein [Candidatus Andeanibacterium colombiense]|uniref:Autotransporter outer membrane beta-barrel domain-containing protein n=1 Tax=Candidatus Andeanibacterium colombiense TaxID=3121345 RepID=A0AAJ5X6I8_9SPHN|nr:MAG: autotransporter outer membrane beta-barrel domain-containing protein [Sphingomonadaceae bacterium]
MFQTFRTRALVSTVLTATMATAALADTTISADRTIPVSTSTAGNVTITDDTVLKVTGSTPITIDSSNTVTIDDEDGVVQADDADGRAGILVHDGTDFGIVNDGSILVTEDFVPEDSDSNSIPDDAIAEASGRYGIHVLSGSPTTGSIDNEGTITVEGLNSYGIAIDSQFTGDLVNGDEAAITVTGDYSKAISVQQAFDGDITLEGTITAVGKGTQVLDVAGDVSGTITIQGSLTKAVSFVNDDGTTMTLSRAALREVDPAVTIAGNVDGGILIANRPYDLDSSSTDEDNDGVADADEAAGAILSYGESPALVIGGATDTTIGAATGRDGDFSLVVDGSVQASGYYSGFEATAVVIGGQGGDVTLTKGIGVSGTIQATTNDYIATALLINAGSTVENLYVSGMIRANVSSTGEANVTAVKDLSGTLKTIDNTGYIYANGAAEDTTVALDLSHNTSGVTITQYLNDIDAAAKADEEEDADYDPDNPTIYAQITGDILLGTGNDVFDISTGSVNGDTYFNNGNDSLSLSDDAVYVGDVHSGAGDFTMSMSGTSKFTGTLDVAGEAAQLTIADSAKFSGGIANGANLSVAVTGGIMEAADGETLSFDTLNVGADGAIAVVLNGDDKTSSSFNVNTATFAEGSKVYVGVTSLADVDGTYTILTANSLTGEPTLDLSSEVALPLLYTGTLDVEDDTITLDIHRRTAEELGLTRPQGQAFEATIAAAIQNSYLQSSLLEAEDIDTLATQLNGLLPDYSGGVFDFVTRSSRLAAAHLLDTGTTYNVSPVGAWLQPVYFTGSKDAGETAGFKNKGWGITGGFERGTGIGYFGLSLAYTQGSTDNGDLQSIDEHFLELAGSWRVKKGALTAFARVSGAKASMSSTRTFTGTVSDTDFTYSSTGDWSGWLLSGMAGASYDFKLGDRFSLRPKAVVDYFRLKENGYDESGSDAIDLSVADRTSSSVAATTTMTLAYRLGSAERDETPFTLEMEGGYRSVLQSRLGATTAYFLEGDDEDGTAFTLTPDALKGGWTSQVRLLAGGYDFTWQLAAGVEQTQGGLDKSVRAGMSIAF